jgi:hypothetical protein
MLKPFKIPMVLMFVTVAILVIGELADGTSLFFVSMMAATLICIGITYNFLGGLSTVSGIAFSGFALSTIVISQFAKVIFFEPADTPLEAPQLTIEVYFVFYLCVMIGCFVYGRLRFRSIKPLDPVTVAQANLQYAISLAAGLIASAVFEINEAASNATGEKGNEAHSVGLAFSTLLLFSLVIAVQSRIRESGGSHSFGVKVFIPWVAILLFGFLQTSRGRMALPSVVYGFTCYFSGYRFKRRHVVTAVCGLVFFQFVLSPFAIYQRGALRSLDFRGRIRESLAFFASPPSWTVITEASKGGVQSGSREEYFFRSGTFVLSRLSAIRADSNMISACSTGYHYGFIALRMDVLHMIPQFLYKDKPTEDSAAFTGRVTGVNPDYVENGEAMITAVSDSFGAFGWLGVIFVGLLVFPITFIIYESIFDFHRPWGIVAIGGFCFTFAQVALGGLVQDMVRAPIAILSLSYIVGTVVRMIPTGGDSGPAFE